MENCLFCKIAAGVIPSTKVYEDELVLAFRDIAPQAPTHILVIPKEHISGISGTFAENIESEVFWCSAKLRFNAGGQGKIVWFDVVPGILYSLSMDDGASEEALLDLANELFVPAQEEI